MSENKNESENESENKSENENETKKKICAENVFVFLEILKQWK